MAADQGLLLEGDADIRNVLFHVNALGFGTRYRRRLEASRTIEVMLNAVLTRLVLSESGDRVAHAMVRTLDGHEFRIQARRFVLAAGGIENARILLLSGYSHELVGRFFTEHAFVDPGWLILEEPVAARRLLSPARDGRGVLGTRSSRMVSRSRGDPSGGGAE